MFGRSKPEAERQAEPGRTVDDDTQAYALAYQDPEPERRSFDDTRAYPAAVTDRAGEDGRDEAVVDLERSRRDRFGGINWGASFFGWLVAVAVSLLLAGVIGGVAAGTGADEDLLPSASDAELGLAAVVTLAVVLLVGYYAGGYVAGRMSRYDGPRQGFGVWVFGVLVTLAAVAAGTLLGAEYNVLERVDLPSIPLSTDEMTTGGVVLAAVLLLGTLLAALAGGAVGRHYHARVDRWA